MGYGMLWSTLIVGSFFASTSAAHGYPLGRNRNSSCVSVSQIGCFFDNGTNSMPPKSKVLEHWVSLPRNVMMAPQFCMLACYVSGYGPYAGIRDGDECFCGYRIPGVLPLQARRLNQSRCNVSCPNKSIRPDSCGGKNALVLFNFSCAPESIPELADSEPPITNLILLCTSSLSILGSTFIILSWFLFREIRFLSRQLIVYISVCDLFSSIAFIMSVVGPNETSSNSMGEANTAPSPACLAQGYMIQFFYLR